MNLILLFPDDFIDNTNRVRILGRRLKHVLEVHRAAVGDELCVGLAEGLIGTGKVIRLDSMALEMEVRLERQPPPALTLTLVLALPRPKVLRRVLRLVSAMGVTALGTFVLRMNCGGMDQSAVSLHVTTNCFCEM